MTDADLKDAVIRLAQPVVASLGLMIWGVEILRAGRTVVRLFVDIPEGEGATTVTKDTPTDTAEIDTAPLSASLDQCEEISRHLGLALEVEDIFPEAYMLEVSTPGLTRCFFQLEQMRPYLGSVVEARLRMATDNTDGESRRLWRGLLDRVEDDAFVLSPVTVTPEGVVTPENLLPVRISWDAVYKVRRMYVFTKPQKPGKGSKPGAKKSECAKRTKKNSVR